METIILNQSLKLLLKVATYSYNYTLQQRTGGRRKSRNYLPVHLAPL